MSEFKIGDEVVLVGHPLDRPINLPIKSIGIVRKIRTNEEVPKIGVEWRGWKYGHNYITGVGSSGWWVGSDDIVHADKLICDIVLTIVNVEGEYVAFDKRGKQYCSDTDIPSLLFGLGRDAEEGYFNV